MLPIFATFLIFLIFYAIKRGQISKENAKKESAFWQRENEANAVRKKDLENLDYIQIPLEDLPIGMYPSKEREELEQKLRALSKERILNLTGLTNTEIKMQYGAGNLETLGAYDDNFTSLVRLLVDYAKTFAEDSHPQEAIMVLEYGVKIQSDVTENYVMLAQLYKEQGEGRKIRSLIEVAGQLNSLSKQVIQKKLEAEIG